MKLHYAPGASSFSSHALLADGGFDFQLEPVDLKSKQQLTEAYASLNPKRQVPVLQFDDGSALTESLAIAIWAARSKPELGLLPDEPLAAGRVFEIAAFVNTNHHPQGFTRLGRTDKFTPNEADYDAVRSQGRQIVDDGFAWLENALSGDRYAVGKLSIADYYAFLVECWAVQRFDYDLPPKCRAHFELMLDRPAVRAAAASEGYKFA